MKLGDISNLVQRGKATQYGEGDVQVIKSGQARGFHEFDFSKRYFAVSDFKIDHRELQNGDILINSTGVGTAGRITIYGGTPSPAVVDSHITIVRLKSEIALSDYVLGALVGIYGFDGIENMATGNGGQIELGLKIINGLELPLPPLEIQRQIVTEFAEEQKIATANKKLIGLYEQKIRTKLAEVWGE